MKTFFTSFFFLAFFISSYSQDNIYVNQAAGGANNGSSWLDAYTDLNDALNAATVSDTIRVAQGNYQPDEPDGNPGSTFWIEQDVVLLGGYNGSGATPDDRDPAIYETILSGDLNGDDVDDDFDDYKSDNVMTVVTVATIISDATLIDGFTIRGGYADGANTGSNRDGGAMYCSGDPLIKQCVFKQNYALGNGGAIAQNFGSGTLVLENCLFENNRANIGGGLAIWGASFDISNCDFMDNITFDGTFQANGGGISISNSSGTVRTCTFKENQAFDYGGGASIWYPESTNNLQVEIINCLFEDNSAGIESGGLGFAAFGNSGSAIIDSCQFNQNTATGGGGLAADLRGNNTSFTLTNTDFAGNNTTQHYGIARIYSWDSSNGFAIVDNCNFNNNNSVYVAGLDIGSIDSGDDYDFSISNCSFLNNEATTFCGALNIWGVEGSTPTFEIDNCLIEGNKAGEKAGGLWVDVSSLAFQATMKNCQIIGNESPSGSAIGIFQYDLSSYVYPNNANLTLENCLLAENISANGIIKVDSFPGLNFVNCTIAGNEGVGIEQEELGNISLQNTIVYNPGFMEIDSQSPDALFTSLGGNLIGDNSFSAYSVGQDIQNGDPQFAGSNDYHLTESPPSPAIDKGVVSDNLSEFDLDGNPRRFEGGCVDIGAYESMTTVSTECITNTREVLAEGLLTIYPNPATDFVTIALPENFQENFAVNIFDAQGKLVGTPSISYGENINIQMLAAGVYSLKIVNEQKVFIGKFIKS